MVNLAKLIPYNKHVPLCPSITVNPFSISQASCVDPKLLRESKGWDDGDEGVTEWVR